MQVVIYMSMKKGPGAQKLCMKIPIISVQINMQE